MERAGGRAADRAASAGDADGHRDGDRDGHRDGHRDGRTVDVGQLADAAELLRALGTPHRLAIVLELAASPRCVHELVERVGISQSLASQHLRILRTIGLVTGTRRGKETLYALADEHVAHIARDALTHGAEPARRPPPPPEPISEEHQP